MDSTLTSEGGNQVGGRKRRRVGARKGDGGSEEGGRKCLRDGKREEAREGGSERGNILAPVAVKGPEGA